MMTVEEARAALDQAVRDYTAAKAEFEKSQYYPETWMCLIAIEVLDEEDTSGVLVVTPNPMPLWKRLGLLEWQTACEREAIAG